MALRIPKRGLAGWCSEIVASCSASQHRRIDRGNYYNQLYLSGAIDGSTSTFNKTNVHISNLSSYLYSPVELRFSLKPEDPTQPDQRAMASGASSLLHRELRRGNVDMAIDDVTVQSLIKGKAFLQLLYTDTGFEPYVLMPELMGVLREDLPMLDRQEAFFFSTYLTPGQFELLVANHPDRDELLRKAKRYAMAPNQITAPDNINVLKTIVQGGGWGTSPVRGPDQSANPNRGIVDWLTAPEPQFAPEVLQSLLRLDEIWVQDAEMGDWTTLQTVGDDMVIEGKYIHRNLFADPMYITDKELLKRSKDTNPLAGHHPFIEFCPNPIHNYFWGRSEVFNVALLQLALNARIDGINALLRRQEDPPYKFTGSKNINQTILAKLKKPGGFFSDSDPTAKVESLAPELPGDLWGDVHELERRFDEMGGFTATMQGRGEAGVRARAQAETLIRTGSPRFKTRALRIERAIEETGGLMLDTLKARYTRKVAAWAKPSADELAAAPQSWWKNFWVAPAPGMKRIEFLMADIPPEWSVRVDSHSSSPAFSYESKELAFALAKSGAIGAEDLIMLTHPPHEEALALQAETREIAKQAMIEMNPSLLLTSGKKK
jgi:hypothetical protein